jgi:uncharacterized membrane protein
VELLVALEGSYLATALRQSFWIYPLVNAGHLLGVALLVGAILPMDVRLLGAWPEIPVANLGQVLLPFAIAGCTLAILSGSLLFIVQPTDYAVKPLFWAKMALVLLGLVNALALRRTQAWREQFPAVPTPPATRLRLAAGLSALLWLTVLLFGRLLGYL